MKTSELRARDDDGLRKELLELRREAFNLRMQAATGQAVRPHQIRRVRRDIARVKTVLSERRDVRGGGVAMPASLLEKAEGESA